MIRSVPFPVSINELDAATLTTALDCEVLNFTSTRIGADRGMLGEIFVVTPEYAAGVSGPNSVVCKFAALREGALASAKRGGTNERELRCYDELLSGIELATPHYYASWYDPDTACFLLVQQALDADSSVDQVAGVSPEHVEMVASRAAKLHAKFWQDERVANLAWLPALDDDRRIGNLTTLAAQGWGPLCELLGDQLTPEERAVGGDFPERLERVLRELAVMPSTLIHGDLRADNLLFAPDMSSVSLIDWQGCGYGPGSFDLAYLIVHSLTVDDRRTHEARLIDGYVHELAAAGVELSLDEFMIGYRKALLYGLVIPCALPVIGDADQPRVKALAGAMARRSIEALRDADLL